MPMPLALHRRLRVRTSTRQRTSPDRCNPCATRLSGHKRPAAHTTFARPYPLKVRKTGLVTAAGPIAAVGAPHARAIDSPSGALLHLAIIAVAVLHQGPKRGLRHRD